jgi:hypothetical protein
VDRRVAKIINVHQVIKVAILVATEAKPLAVLMGDLVAVGGQNRQVSPQGLGQIGITLVGPNPVCLSLQNVA